ncbi:glucose 1-dehydrogenase [Azospirillum sp. TSO35-2]|uniref:SDR family NAD(P)-dependent oxidoreductase n=1 Tax=Azospirillum sp. TSO35-2 TaxID=716796 RepID=UPI000D61ABC6|nr:glucose 1-dehydrogenase [Azospirillum sp. TSO35-2]PWC33597.1 short-chain dehydrogenase [Azospirillum sp. TSO35-2]
MVDLVGSGFGGQVVLVTGATSGIGRATALAFARAGALVVAAGRDRERGEAVAGACADAGGSAVFLAADLTEPDAVRALVAAVAARFGRLDIAFNNAGYQEPRAALADQPDDAFRRVFATNVESLFHAMKAELAVMLEQGQGVIVNNASVSGVRNPNPGLSLYSASKAAAISLTRSAALEYAPRGIRINAVSPGRVVTPMMLGSGIADMATVAAGLPSRRLGEPGEVAQAVLWLASDAASFVIGHNLCVDGGFLAT